MNDIPILNKKKIPIVGKNTSQELIIKFSKNDDGTGNVNFSFDPPMEEAKSDEQKAALNVANQIITLLKLENEGVQNAPSTEEKQ